jgi:hypothetical protein
MSTLSTFSEKDQQYYQIRVNNLVQFLVTKERKALPLPSR